MSHTTTQSVATKKRRLPRISEVNSIRSKFLASTILGALTAVVLGVFSMYTLVAVQKDIDSLETSVTDVIDSFSNFKNDIWEARVQVALTNTSNSTDTNIDQKALLEQQFIKAYQSLDVFTNNYQTPLNDELLSQVKKYENLVNDEFLTAVLAGNTEGSERIRNSSVSPAAVAMLETVDEISSTVNVEAARIAAVTQVTVNRSFVLTIIIAASGIAVTLLFSLLVARGIRRNTVALQRSIEALAKGDLTTTAQVRGHDEVAQMAESLEIAQESLRATMRDVVTNANESVRMSQDLTAASSQVAASASETSAQAAVVATAAEQVSGNVQTVAAGAEQMSASIREIAQNAQEATAVAQTAATTADSTNVTISRLGDSSKEIGDVIKTITSIAEQTNLLALNATIEAARAGEAGKGFAVVASEVKDLAAESARAAEDVSRRVQAIQTDTDSAIGAIGQISEIISSINNYQLTIASAVEEQTATTNEMSRSAAEAATGSSEIAANINGVAAVVEESTAAVAEMDRTIEEVATQAQALRSEVQVFKF